MTPYTVMRPVAGSVRTSAMRSARTIFLRRVSSTMRFSRRTKSCRRAPLSNGGAVSCAPRRNCRDKGSPRFSRTPSWTLVVKIQ
ncbi:Uncharacterised protein [Bordetella pertussis]|nr:Uncharacterised protein [Bordetella pertussis]CFW02137.1 Uncharacterised protein [Bordetella pertussis]